MTVPPVPSVPRTGRPGELAIDVHHLGKKFGDRTVLDGIDSVAAGGASR